jgi:hypothetical protein
MILNFSPPTAKVENTYAAPARTNPYLTSSQYEGMQLHTPSGYYYQGGNIYEPYTPPKRSNLLGGLLYGLSPMGSQFSQFGMPRSNKTNTDNKDIITIGNQSFKPFTGNAPGIVNGNLSMVSMLNQQPMYQPQPLPNLFTSLNSNLSQPQQMLSAPSYGAGRFIGLLNSPITTNV